MQLDLCICIVLVVLIKTYLPTYALAFEYQGVQHFCDFYYFGTSVRMYQQLDQEKRGYCKQLGITLIEIPYWWNYTK